MSMHRTNAANAAIEHAATTPTPSDFVSAVHWCEALALKAKHSAYIPIMRTNVKRIDGWVYWSVEAFFGPDALDQSRAEWRAASERVESVFLACGKCRTEQRAAERANATSLACAIELY